MNIWRSHRYTNCVLLKLDIAFSRKFWVPWPYGILAPFRNYDTVSNLCFITSSLSNGMLRALTIYPSSCQWHSVAPCLRFPTKGLIASIVWYRSWLDANECLSVMKRENRFSRFFVSFCSTTCGSIVCLKLSAPTATRFSGVGSLVIWRTQDEQRLHPWLQHHYHNGNASLRLWTVRALWNFSSSIAALFPFEQWHQGAHCTNSFGRLQDWSITLVV